MSPSNNLDMEKITQIIESSAAELSDHEKEELYNRLFSNPDELKDQARAEAIAEIEPQYELDPVDDFMPLFYMESDKTIALGRGKHEQKLVVRYLNLDDMTLLSQFVPDAWQFMARKGPESLKKVGFQNFLSALTRSGIGVAESGKIQRLTAAFFRLLAHCLSNPETKQVVAPNFLRSCPTSQIVEAIRALYEVNQDDFLGLWRALPGDIRDGIASYIGKISGPIKNLRNLASQTDQDSSGTGGTPSGGATHGSTQSQENTDGELQKLKGSLSQSAGDTSKPSRAAKPKKPISVG